MRAIGFMVGDWVDIFPDYCQILSIRKNGRICTTEVSNYKVERDIGMFEQIEFKKGRIYS